VADSDKTCSKAQAEWIEKEMIAAETKQLRFYPNAGHDFFSWSNQQAFVQNILTNLTGATSGAAHLSAATLSSAVIWAALF